MNYGEYYIFLASVLVILSMEKFFLKIGHCFFCRMVIKRNRRKMSCSDT